MQHLNRNHGRFVSIKVEQIFWSRRISVSSAFCISPAFCRSVKRLLSAARACSGTDILKTQKFNKRNQRNFWLKQLMVKSWATRSQPFTWVTRVNFRLLRVLDFSVINIHFSCSYKRVLHLTSTQLHPAYMISFIQLHGRRDEDHSNRLALYLTDLVQAVGNQRQVASLDLPGTFEHKKVSIWSGADETREK